MSCYRKVCVCMDLIIPSDSQPSLLFLVGTQEETQGYTYDKQELHHWASTQPLKSSVF